MTIYRRRIKVWIKCVDCSIDFVCSAKKAEQTDKICSVCSKKRSKKVIRS